MWPRLVHAEARRELQKRDEACLADRVPESLLRQEDKENSVCREQPWCAWCVMEKGRAKPHLQRPVESVKIPEFEMDFCYLLQDPHRRHEPGDQAWATTLVIVDVAAQNALCAALSTESDENGVSFSVTHSTCQTDGVCGSSSEGGS